MLKKRFRNFIVTASTMALAITIATPVIKAEESAEIRQEFTFTDVNPKDTHYDAIYQAYELDFISGYQDGTFKPYQSLTRSNVVKALGKYVVATNGKELSEFDLTDVKPFNDVPANHPDKELYTYSLIVKQAEIFSGSNNNLMPTRDIQRQQMAKVLVKAFDLENLEGVEPKVTDNDQAFNEFVPFIDILSENNVTTVENFRPAASVVRGQMASFFVAANEAIGGEVVSQKVMAVNLAENSKEMDSALLALDSVIYKNLHDRLEVANYLLNTNKGIDFSTKGEVIRAIDTAVEERFKLLSPIYEATNAKEMAVALNALSLPPYYSNASYEDQLWMANVFLKYQVINGERLKYYSLFEVGIWFYSVFSIDPEEPTWHWEWLNI